MLRHGLDLHAGCDIPYRGQAGGELGHALGGDSQGFAIGRIGDATDYRGFRRGLEPDRFLRAGQIPQPGRASRAPHATRRNRLSVRSEVDGNDQGDLAVHVHRHAARLELDLRLHRTPGGQDRER